MFSTIDQSEFTPSGKAFSHFFFPALGTTLSLVVINHNGVYWACLSFELSLPSVTKFQFISQLQLSFSQLSLPLLSLPSVTKYHFISQSPCMSGPCQNGGSCVPMYEKNSYVCLCVKGYTGSTCQTGKTTVTLELMNDLADIILKSKMLLDYTRTQFLSFF